MGPVTVTVTGSVAASTVIAMDYLRYGVIGIQTIASSSLSVYNVEMSLDDLGAATINWFSSGSSALTGNTLYKTDAPIRSIRLNVTSGTSLSVVTMTVMQSG